jgi:hypothetical protein
MRKSRLSGPRFNRAGRRMARVRLSILLSALAALAAPGGCHSYHVEATVENHTGAPIELLEVDYPSASFGADALAAGGVFHYRIQLRGSGPIKVQYTGEAKKQIEIDGPNLSEPQEGALDIVLLPGGKAEFHPRLSPGS